jgi:hypothetical protein
MPINNSRGWRTRVEAARHRQTLNEEREAVRAERIKMKVAGMTGTAPTPAPEPKPSPQPAKQEYPDPSEMTNKALREALIGAGLEVPLNTAKPRLIELYKEHVPPPEPPAPGPNEVPPSAEADIF